MSAAERPLLEEGLRFNRHDNEAGISYVVKNPATLKYYRFGQIEAWLMQRMDGTRTVQQICDELRTEVGVSAAPEALAVLVRRLREMGLVQRTPEERSALLLERLRERRRERNEEKSNLLRLRFSVGDPDPLLRGMTERMPFFWTRGFVAASVVAFVLYFVVLAANWTRFAEGSAVLLSPTQMTLGIFAIMYGSFAVTAVIHEFGHGLTCKRHGGEVHEMGVMLLYFMPAFYCNVSDAWTFEKRAHRIWVTLAGGWIQLWVAAVAALVWIWTEPGTFISEVAFYTAVLSGGFSVLLNYNPLIPLDGYYALVDVLEMPNLRQRSFAYTGALVRRHLLRLDVEVPSVTARERRIFVTYGILAAAYTTLILTTIALLVGRFMGARFGAWGWALFGLLLFAATGRTRGRVLALVRDFTSQKLAPGSRRRRAAAGAAIGVAALALLALVPWTTHVTATALVEPERRIWLRSALDARLGEVLVREGGEVEAGGVVAVLRDPGLDLDIARATAAYGALAAQADAARAVGDVAAARAAQLEAEAQRVQLDLLIAQRGALILRAPEHAVLVTPRPHERIGGAFAAGDSVLQLWSGASLHTRIRVEQRIAGGIVEGSVVRIRFPGDAAHTWRTRVRRLEPAATDEGVVLIAELPAEALATIRAGMQGRARITTARTTVGGALVDRWRRTIRGDLFL